MKTKIINILSAILLITVLSGCGKKEAPVPEVTDNFFFKIQFVLGDVKISGSAGTVAANPGDRVKVSDIVTTGKNAVADLVFGTSGAGVSFFPQPEIIEIRIITDRIFIIFLFISNLSNEKNVI